jgi:hypothetical protein
VDSGSLLGCLVHWAGQRSKVRNPVSKKTNEDTKLGKGRQEAVAEPEPGTESQRREPSCNPRRGPEAVAPRPHPGLAW